MTPYRMLAAVFLVVVGAIVIAQVGAESPGPRSEASAPDDADREAIRQTARAFAAAFNTHDAQAVAALFTEQAESRASHGPILRGRAAIANAYADFFQANPGVSIEVLVQSIRFPAQNLAIEEGLLRQSRGPASLPATASYVAILTREDGQWKIALSSESGAGQRRLEDLDWLLGEWVTTVGDGQVTVTYRRDPKTPAIIGTWTRTEPGRAPRIGTTRIALDPETQQIRSWSFEDDGAHSQALWSCDGKSWILDLRGVLVDGTPVAERILCQRVAADTITWRAIDRVLGEKSMPDTPPMRLTRAAVSK